MPRNAREQLSEKQRDQMRGCLFGGAAGDALGYAVEFMDERSIFLKYGDEGITQYDLDTYSGKAEISDDTQMTLFTANGLLVGDTRGNLRGIRTWPRHYVADAYQDWLDTQRYPKSKVEERERVSWLWEVPELHHRRAPGNTCLTALQTRRHRKHVSDYIASSINTSKGCGGVMRVAPVALNVTLDMEALDMEAAQIAAITHSHSLGYMPAAVLCHIINRIVFPGESPMTLKEIVLEAKETCEKLFRWDECLAELTGLIDIAVKLSENHIDDLENIQVLGEGWVAEETLAIAIYCSLRHANDFSAGIIAATNHSGDSDSTAAVTGNILGALLGYEALEDKWKENLECADVILEMADDLWAGCRMSEFSDYDDPAWTRKYIEMHWK